MDNQFLTSALHPANMTTIKPPSAYDKNLMEQKKIQTNIMLLHLPLFHQTLFHSISVKSMIVFFDRSPARAQHDRVQSIISPVHKVKK